MSDVEPAPAAAPAKAPAKPHKPCEHRMQLFEKTWRADGLRFDLLVCHDCEAVIESWPNGRHQGRSL